MFCLKKYNVLPQKIRTFIKLVLEKWWNWKLSVHGHGGCPFSNRQKILATIISCLIWYFSGNYRFCLRVNLIKSRNGRKREWIKKMLLTLYFLKHTVYKRTYLNYLVLQENAFREKHKSTLFILAGLPIFSKIEK